jgi:ABC-type Mn2+/Zn2+ transport system ATPase subunit
MRVADNPPAYKRMEELSGGAQVSLLLTLLLSSENNCPLVIDQPEDELDKSYLRDTVLPALRRLKGRRQVILATHDANIVVNGDADQVIYLTATHDYAGIAEQDAIENRAIKNAIIDLLDGGSEAFEMRKEKYGF